jgi:hypothetical protein
MKRFPGWCALGMVMVMVIGFGTRAGAQTADEPAGEPAAAPTATPTAGAPAAAPTGAEPTGAPTVGDPGHWAISFDRLFGFDYSRETDSMNGVDQQTVSATSFSLFSNREAASLSAFSFPRAAVDVFLGPGLSLGTSLGVVYGSETMTPTGGTATTGTVTGISVTPRIGYVAHLTPSISFWPRAGISVIYVSSSPSGTPPAGSVDTSSTSHLIAATVEAPFVFTLAPRVAFTFGPTFDISFSGSQSATVTGYGTTTIDEKVLEIGAQAGFVVTL